jgi:hypothetical protein
MRVPRWDRIGDRTVSDPRNGDAPASEVVLRGIGRVMTEDDERQEPSPEAIEVDDAQPVVHLAEAAPVAEAEDGLPVTEAADGAVMVPADIVAEPVHEHAPEAHGDVVDGWPSLDDLPSGGVLEGRHANLGPVGRLRSFSDEVAGLLWSLRGGEPQEGRLEPSLLATGRDLSDRSQRSEDTIALRFVLGVVSLLSLAVGGVAYVLHVAPVRTSCMLVFCLVGIGSAPWQLNALLGSFARLTLTFVTSIAWMTLLPLEMLIVGEWHPTVAVDLAFLVCVPMHALGIWRSLGEAGTRSPPPWPSRYLPLARSSEAVRTVVRESMPGAGLAIAGAALCLVAALIHRPMTPEFYGFLPRIGMLWYVGLALLLLGLVVGRDRSRAAAVTCFLLVLVLTLTPALVYDEPRSQSAAKHVDFILQIRSLHQLETPVAVYNAWSGFFAAMAWLCHVAGIGDPMRLAAFWPALLGIFRVVVLRYVFGQILERRYQCWIAVALAVLADSISADYFSPQSIGFVVGMAAIGFALSRSPDEPRDFMLFLAGMVLAVSHQFSPYAVGGTLLILALFRQLRAWWSAALVLVPALLWAAAHQGALEGVFSLSKIGQTENFRPPPTLGVPGLDRLPVVGNVTVALLVGALGVGLMAGITLLLHVRERRYWALALCPLAGLLVVAVNPYGQEGIFRAALFGLPWLAVLASTLLVRSHLLAPAVLLGTTACLLVAFLVSSFGLDAINVIRPSDLAAVRYFQQQGGPHPPTPQYMLLLNPGDQPTTPGVSGGGHQVWGRDRVDDPPGQRPGLGAAQREKFLTARFLRYTLDAKSHPSLYALWSPAGAQYGRAYALQTLRQAEAIRDAFREAPYWKVVYVRDGTYLFKFDPSRYKGRPA